MCRLGNIILLSVPILAELSYTGKARWDVKSIDSCIAPIVEALNNGGIFTFNSRCGHGKEDGRIDLQDGRILIIKKSLDDLQF